MSDLISRSELLKAFNNKNVQITFDLPVEEVLGEDVDLDDFAMLVQDAIQSYKQMVIDTIKNQPTAYDIDKIVKELEALVKEYDERIERRKGDCYFDENEKLKVLQERATGVERAIKIVKAGGVSDDVCEWKLKDACYTSSIKHYDALPTSIVKTFTSCPYCGKKIKIVGD